RRLRRHEQRPHLLDQHPRPVEALAARVRCGGHRVLVAPDAPLPDAGVLLQPARRPIEGSVERRRRLHGPAEPDRQSPPPPRPPPVPRGATPTPGFGCGISPSARIASASSATVPKRRPAHSSMASGVTPQSSATSARNSTMPMESSTSPKRTSSSTPAGSYPRL